MDKLKKFQLMEKIARELEDVRNSQQAVLEKIGKIEVDNIELGDKNIEKTIPDIYQRTANNSDAIKALGVFSRADSRIRREKQCWKIIGTAADQ
jgi:ElaB/YqjD/DUF883 family membrane-anchored ribosome-binding protein